MSVEELLSKIDVVFEGDMQDFHKINVQSIVKITKEAALLKCSEFYGEEWLPLSQLRCDMNGNIFLSSWKYNKMHDV